MEFIINFSIVLFPVHECLFCPQRFGSAAEKDDHTLEHFAQETCVVCHQNLIRIGCNLYTLHNAVTCIKMELKSEVSVESDSSIGILTDNKSSPEDSCNEDEWMHPTYTFPNTVCIEEVELEIKSKPRTENEELNEYLNGNSLTDSLDIPNQQLENEPINVNSTRKKKISVKYQEALDLKNGKDALKRKRAVFKSTSSKATKKKSPDKINVEHFVCNICGKVLSNKYAMQRHKIVVHKTSGDLFCNVCIKLFSTAEDLAEHKTKCVKTRGYTNTAVRFECDICGGVLKNKHVLRGHMRWKHNPAAKKFKCKLCESSFVRQSLLDIHHNRAHLDIKEYICSICGRGFKTKDQLKSHTNSHTGEKPFKCTFNGCEKSFRSRSNRENHMLTHTGEKRYQCSVSGCNRPFGFAKDLRRHIFQVHKICVKKYPCPICNEVFPENSFLKKHMLNHNVLL